MFLGDSRGARLRLNVYYFVVFWLLVSSPVISNKLEVCVFQLAQQQQQQILAAAAAGGSYYSPSGTPGSVNGLASPACSVTPNGKFRYDAAIFIFT